MAIFGLNNFLMPEIPPITDEGQTSSSQFDADNERDTITAAKIKNLNVDTLMAGTINVRLNIGGANVFIDGANNRIVINDGTVDRVIIGYLQNGF